MGLKQIKKNYTTLLKAFSEVGVKLNESQKESLDNFMISLETAMNENRDNAIRATKKIVEERLEKQYKEAFEGILSEQQKLNECAGKIQEEISKKENLNLLSEAVDKYLSEYVEKVLPNKTIVDYARMEKLEKVHESLKNMFIVTDPEIAEKINESTKASEAEKTKLQKKYDDEVKLMESKCKEAEEKCDNLRKQLDESLLKNFISEKTKNLPIAESKKLTSKLSKMTLNEAKDNFNTVCESITQEIEDERAANEEEKNLEEAISDILEGKKAKSEKTDSDKDAEGTEVVQTADDEITTDDTEVETSDSVEDEDEDQVADVAISESQMQTWINSLNRITPNK